MKSVWRSWFWNLVLMVCMFLMAVAAMGSVTSQASMPVDVSGRIPGMIGFGLLAGLFAVATVRSLLLGVWARPAGIVLRGLTRTTTIPWGEIAEIKVAPVTSGAAGLAHATSPVVVWKRPGKADRLVELSVMGGYGVIRSRPTLQERAAEGLREHMMRWRKEHAGSLEAPRR